MELSEFKRILRQVMILPVIALMVLAGGLIWQIHSASSTVDQIQSQDERIARTNRIERLVVDEETGLRGYEITGDPRFLDPYRQAQAPLQQAVADQIKNLTGPGQNIKTFVAEHQDWHEHFAEPLIAITAAGGETRDVDLNLTGKSAMDAMRSHLEAIVRNASQVRSDDISRWRSQVGEFILGLILLAIATGLFIGLFTRGRLEAVSSAFRKALSLQRVRTDELFQSEQHLRTTLASIGDGVITCDANGNIQMMNPIAQELTGWLESIAHHRPLEEVFHIINEQTRELAENPVAKVKRLNRVVGLANHTLLVRKDGTEIAIDDSGAPIRNAAGVLTGVVMVFRDVTMERKTRAALLANEKLAVAGRLAATIAHEIHNPLDSVSNLLYLLENGPTDPEEAKQFLHTAQTELARVTQISRAMLSLYREAKAPVLIHLRDMLEDLLLLMDRRFHDLGVTVSTDFPNEIAIDGFPGELRQVFTNLIANAAEAAGQGGKVHIRVFPRPAGPDPADPARRLESGAIVEIADNGPGIPRHVHEQLFKPFFTTKGESGTGLGLWVSQGIIRKHAGTLSLASETEGPDRGTVASVFLATKPVIDPGGD